MQPIPIEGGNFGMKFNKTGLVFFVFSMFLVVNTVSAAAESKQVGPTDGISSQGSIGEGCTPSSTIVFPMSTNYLKVGHCYIIGNSDSQVEVKGDTESYSTVDTIAVDLYLQQWDESSGVWSDVVHVGEFKNFNSTTVSGGKTVNVPADHYYRTRALHWVSHDGELEQLTCYSSYIYVD